MIPRCKKQNNNKIKWLKIICWSESVAAETVSVNVEPMSQTVSLVAAGSNTPCRPVLKQCQPDEPPEVLWRCHGHKLNSALLAHWSVSTQVKRVQIASALIGMLWEHQSGVELLNYVIPLSATHGRQHTAPAASETTRNNSMERYLSLLFEHAVRKSGLGRDQHRKNFFSNHFPFAQFHFCA